MEKFVPFFAKPGTEVDNSTPENLPDNLFFEFFDMTTIKALLINCLRVDIASNNVKASIVREILPPEWRKMELGAGTNRVAFQHNGVAVLFALDRRGIIDSLTEFKRSAEVSQFVARTYESNGLITIQELVTPMAKQDFYLNERTIKEMLAQLATAYIFNDIGYSSKNYCNWGYRPLEHIDRSPGKSSEKKKEICCLDYGYMYPLLGQSKELFICPRCGTKISWNSNYTAFRCNNPSCRIDYSVTEIWRKMDTAIIDKEDELLHRAISGTKADFIEVEKIISELYDMID